jgi:hypothetical protein
MHPAIAERVEVALQHLDLQRSAEWRSWGFTEDDVHGYVIVDEGDGRYVCRKDHPQQAGGLFPPAPWPGGTIVARVLKDGTVVEE